MCEKQLNRKLMFWFMRQYFEYPEDCCMHPYSSPIQADLRNLPPATLINAGHDPLCDHAAYYAFKLQEAGVAATNTTYRNSIHGFFNSISIEANEAMVEVCIALQFSFESHRHALMQLNLDLISFIELIKDKHAGLSISALPSDCFEGLATVVGSSEICPLSQLAISCGVEFDDSMTSLFILQQLSDQSFPLHRFLSACYLNNRLDIVNFLRETINTITRVPSSSDLASSSSSSSSSDPSLTSQTEEPGDSVNPPTVPSICLEDEALPSTTPPNL